MANVIVVLVFVFPVLMANFVNAPNAVLTVIRSGPIVYAANVFVNMAGRAIAATARRVQMVA